MAKATLFEKLEKEHQELLTRIDELDKMVLDVLNEWGTAGREDEQDSETFLEENLAAPVQKKTE